MQDTLMMLTCPIFHQKDTFRDWYKQWTIEVNVNMHAALSENLCAYQWYTQGNMTCPDGTSSHIPGAKSCVPSPTYSLQIPHISLLQTVCGREIWVFGCNNPDRVPTPRGRFWRQIPASFLQHLPQVCQVGHTMDRCIKLLPITLTTCGVQQQQVYGRQEPTK